MSTLTEKQKKYIDWICEMLDIEFTGITKKDAWEFINQHKDEAYEIKMGSYYSHAYYDGSDDFYVPYDDCYY